nr:hypothetical protein [Paraburkholderia caballeronis]
MPDVERLREPLVQPVEQRPQRLHRIARAFEHQHELVAGEARDEVARAQSACNRTATSRSTWSPASWPNRSLTGLKRSRSSTPITSGTFERALRADACST